MYKINVLHPMKITDVLYSNLCCDLSIRNILILRTITEDKNILHILAVVRSETHLLAVSYAEKYFSFVVNTAEN